jgi:hypothetical protein
MQIYCENCGAAIPGANINIQEKLAVCPECGSVFSFADHLTRQPLRRKTKPPESLSITERNDQLEIQFRWRQILKAEEHFITLLAGIGAVVLARLAYAMYDGLDTILEGLLGVGFVLGALACVYLVLVLLLNKVTLTIDDRLIQTRHRPILWFGHNVRRADVMQVECKVAAYNDENPNSEFIDYNVQVLLHDGSSVTLAALRRDLAFYIAQVIEDYLDNDELPRDAQAPEDDESLALLQQAEEDAADNSLMGKSGG